ncbi:MAG TPA: PQQ-binding-like beta-propeller repeat protein [Promineifilum sp.]|nr:PQQ-binding-like beta-propeller repeat protein [Promineifilum sp.]
MTDELRPGRNNGQATRRGRRVACLGLLLALLLTACRNSGQPEAIVNGAAMHRANPARTGVFQTEGLAKYSDIKWQFQAEDWVFGAPAVLGDAVYTVSYDGNVYALDRETGAERWRFETEQPIIAAPAAADGLIFVAGMDGNVYALSAADGAERWRIALGSGAAGDGITGSPAVVGDTVYVAGESGLLLALEAETGAERWRFQKEGQAIAFSPAVANGTIYVGVANGLLYALDAATGAEQWTFDPVGEQAERYSPTADVVAGDGVVYFTTVDHNLAGQLFAIDTTTHTARWVYQTDTENFSAPALAGDLLIWGGLDKSIHAISAATGEPAWDFATGDIVFSAPAVAGDLVYVGGADKNLYALNTADGQVRWQFRADSGVSSATVADGAVFVGTERGLLYALE